MLLLLLLILVPLTVWAQAPCSHWASPNGSGSACTESSPCRIGQFWSKASPGTVLCLNDGTYTDTITPPGTLAGTSGAPITIRARNDGKVLIDAQHGGFAVLLSGTSGAANHWFVVEGINAANGLEAVYRVSGNNNTLRRVIGWNGTSGQADSNIFRITGQGNWCEDCAGWGMNSRKIMDMAQGGNVGGGGFLRGWAEWNDHPQGASNPNNTWLISYNTGNARFYNVLGTWNQRGDVANAEGVMEIARECDGNLEAEGTKVKGALLYVMPGATYTPGYLVHGFCASNFWLEDVAALVPQGFGHVRPFAFDKGSSAQPSGSVCTNCLGVHSGSPSSNEGNSGWQMPGFREGASLQAATGGAHPFTLQPGLCRRFDRSGTLTSTPLWPWPLNQRIKDARIASGFPVVDVTADVEQMLGPIPAACKGAGPPPTGDTVTPVVQLVSPTHGATVSGTALVVSATATDNVGVIGITWTLNGEALFEQPGGNVSFTVDTTKHPNDTYVLGATARDAAGNVGVSNQVTVTVDNRPQPTPPQPGLHPAMSCRGELGAQGVITVDCQPVAAPRTRWER